MTQIEPAYATFEQGKKLKEKGFNQRTKMVWLDALGQHLREVHLSLELNDKEYNAPEQWQIVEWLRVEKGIWIQPFIQFENAIEDECAETLEYGYGVYNFEEMRKMNQNVFPYICRDEVDNHVFGFKSPQEAYSAAFDHILNELI
jgi:hypothetical protein